MRDLHAEVVRGLVEGGVRCSGQDDLGPPLHRAGVPRGLHRQHDRLGAAAGEDAGAAAELVRGEPDDPAFERDDAGERRGVEAVDLQHLLVGGGGEVVHRVASGVVHVRGDLAAAHGQVGVPQPGELGEQVGGGAAGFGQGAVGRVSGHRACFLGRGRTAVSRG
ncbi:hypothetical protein [Actinomadura madurae]|uniref:hypothetical protein n=1 Tax=Actinomadura madurae TaxID=1993 RepID=UPI003FD7B013